MFGWHENAVSGIRRNLCLSDSLSQTLEALFNLILMILQLKRRRFAGCLLCCGSFVVVVVDSSVQLRSALISAPQLSRLFIYFFNHRFGKHISFKKQNKTKKKKHDNNPVLNVKLRKQNSRVSYLFPFLICGW